jgi:hypothetical protein
LRRPGIRPDEFLKEIRIEQWPDGHDLSSRIDFSFRNLEMVLRSNEIVAEEFLPVEKKNLLEECKKAAANPDPVLASHNEEVNVRVLAGNSFGEFAGNKNSPNEWTTPDDVGHQYRCFP